MLIQQLAAGRLRVIYRGEPLNYPSLARPPPAPRRQAAQVAQVNRRPWKPAADHP